MADTSPASSSSPTHRPDGGWRAGQRAFNDLCVSDPEIAAAIRGTADDPFYDDGRLDAFHRRVAELRAAGR